MGRKKNNSTTAQQQQQQRARANLQLRQQQQQQQQMYPQRARIAAPPMPMPMPMQHPNANASNYSGRNQPSEHPLVTEPITINQDKDPVLLPDFKKELDNALLHHSPHLRIPLNSKSEHFKVINDLCSTPATKVTEIDMIANPMLWKRFCEQRKAKIIEKSTDSAILSFFGVEDRIVATRIHHSQTNASHKTPYSDNIALLFHCTKADINQVLDQGLDSRLGVGGLCGRGIYFSCDPEKSIQYDRHSTLLVFAVMLGDCLAMPANAQATREPPKVLSEKRHPIDLFFDSIICSPAGKNEFVIFNNDQCVPLYAVKYARGPSNIHFRPSEVAKYATARQSLPPIAFYELSNHIHRSNATTWPFFVSSIFNPLMPKIPKVSAIPVVSREKITVDVDESFFLPRMMPSKKRGAGKVIDLTSAPVLKRAPVFIDLTGKKSPEVIVIDDSDDEKAVAVQTNKRTMSSRSGEKNILNGTRTRPLPEISSIDDSDDEKSVEVQTNVQTRTMSSRSGGKNVLNGTRTRPLPEILSIDDSDDEKSVEVQTNKRTISSSWYGGKNVLNGTRTRPFPDILSIDDSDDVAVQDNKSVAEPDFVECTICFNEFPATQKGAFVVLKCHHKLCSICQSRIQTSRKTMSGAIKTFCKCPYCGQVDGEEVGTCPDGKMTKKMQGAWITVSYTITDPAHQTMRSTYFPNTPAGRRVVELMEVAWERRLVFSIGTSMTTGIQNTVVWNIHHKTMLSGGAANHGYPDDGYLDRVTAELEERGVE